MGLERPARMSFEQVWENHDFEVQLDGHSPGSTLRPRIEPLLATLDMPDLPNTDPGRSGPWLPSVRLAGEGQAEASDSDLEVLGDLGQGGMGLVQAARQRSLGREVAIKRLRADQRDPRRAAALIEEARIAGCLEHPDVVPIHMLGLDEAGLPIIVMKRVRGVPWNALITNTHHEAWGQVIGDRLRWNIETLIRVCRAVELAHSQLILHRDLKTENVMVGAYGEVYVLDWGVAARLDPESRQTAPDGALVGTPAYMAPEMAGGRALSVRTDVYLLGAMLHEILTGQPRHPGEHVYEVMVKAYTSEPHVYGAGVPESLAAVCNRACAADPQDRYESVVAFRVALLEFLQHRASLDLCDEANARLLEMASFDDSGLHHARLRRIFYECRFGFRQALRAWPGNQTAREGLRRALKLMAERELTQGDAEAALALIEELGGGAEEMRERVQVLKRNQRQRQARVSELEGVAYSTDTRVSARGRAWLGMLAAFGALGFGVGMLVVSHFVEGVVDYWLAIPVLSVFLVTALVLGLVGRRKLQRNLASRRFWASLQWMLLFMVLMRVMSWRLEIPFYKALAVEQGLLALGAALVGASLEPRLRWPARWMLLGALICAIYPDAGMVIYTIFPSVFIFWASMMWHLAARDLDREQAERSRADATGDHPL